MIALRSSIIVGQTSFLCAFSVPHLKTYSIAGCCGAQGRDMRLRSVGNDEREQTLNQLLTEMDGFDSDRGDKGAVIVLAATNRCSAICVGSQWPPAFMCVVRGQGVGPLLSDCTLGEEVMAQFFCCEIAHQLTAETLRWAGLM
jgi:hypothetical protein